jgi:hypothetical protein
VKAILIGVVFVVGMVTLASADDWIIFGQTVEQSQMLTASEIFLKNQSLSRLQFYASSGAEGWTEFMIDPRDSALIKRSDITIAISTSRSNQDPEADAQPSISPNDIIEGSTAGVPVDHGVYTFAHFTGGQRAEFCWNKTRGRWIVVAEGLAGC